LGLAVWRALAHGLVEGHHHVLSFVMDIYGFAVALFCVWHYRGSSEQNANHTTPHQINKTKLSILSSLPLQARRSSQK
jgi:hypothetical protein